MNIYSDSKTDVKLRCDYCVTIKLFEYAQNIFSRLMVVCCMLVPHNTYRVPHYHTRHVSGSSCSCKHRFFCEYLRLLSTSFFLIIWIQYTIDNHSGNKKCSLNRPMLTFEPKVNCCAAANIGLTVSNRATKYTVSNVSTYISRFVEGFRRWRGIFWLQKRNHDLQGSCSLANHCNLSVRSEQNSSKVQNAACNVYRRPLAFQEFTVWRV
jgi:hypothetical protein